MTNVFIPEPGVFSGVTNPAYHADRSAVSSTWLKKIEKSAFHLRSYLDSPPDLSTPALIMGSAVDCLIFEPDQWDAQFTLLPELNLRTTADRHTKSVMEQEALATGKLVISHSAMEEAMGTARAIRTNPRMADILKNGKSQQVFVWVDPVTGLLCKCKADQYDEATGTAYDLKTALDGSYNAFSRAIANFSYHTSAAFYLDGIRACGLPAKRFVFAVAEKPDGRDILLASPKLTAFYELSEDDIEAGRDTYSSGLAAINFCLSNNEWPGYSDQIQVISRPVWARRTDVEQVSSL
jgi:exodeoxyribonuclease VIII